MVAAVLLVLLILGALGGAHYSRSKLIQLDVTRLHQEASARMLADSALELLAAQGAHGGTRSGERFETTGGEAGFLLGAPVTPSYGGAYRPAFVFARAATTRRELHLHVIENASPIGDGPPVPGRTRLEQVRDITGAVPNIPRAEPSAADRERLIGLAAAATSR